MIVLLPQDRVINLGHVCRAKFELLELPSEAGKPVAKSSKLTMAMSDGEGLVVEGPVAKGLWDLLSGPCTLGMITEDGKPALKQMGPNPNQIVRAANVPNMAVG